MLPFDREAFFAVIEAYNEAVWPMQFGLLALALAATAAAVRGTPLAGRMVLVVLAALWAWMAICYHWLFFTRINPAAWLFGALFGAQAWLFGRAAVRGAPAFGRRGDASARLGAALVVYALLVYPVLSQFGGHPYPRSPTFGLPCPTTIFTLGLLLLTTGRVSAWLLAIPVAWAAVGTTAAFSFGVREDLGLAAAAVIAGVTLASRRPA